MCRGDFYEIFYETADLELLFPDGSGAWTDRYGESDLFHGRNPALGRRKSCDSGSNGLSGSSGCFSALRDHWLWPVERYGTDMILYKREKKKSGVEKQNVFSSAFSVCFYIWTSMRIACIIKLSQKQVLPVRQKIQILSNSSEHQQNEKSDYANSFAIG